MKKLLDWLLDKNQQLIYWCRCKVLKEHMWSGVVGSGKLDCMFCKETKIDIREEDEEIIDWMKQHNFDNFV